MATMRSQGLYISIPVQDLARARDFYAALGFELDTQFSNDNAVAVKLGDGQVLMLATRAFWQTLTDRAPCNTRRELQCLLAMQLGSRAEVDALVEAAVAHGAEEPHGPEDHGFMYSRAFNDLDGNGWGPFCMDADAPPAQD